jgi:hypothetical protein
VLHRLSLKVPAYGPTTQDHEADESARGVDPDVDR